MPLVFSSLSDSIYNSCSIWAFSSSSFRIEAFKISFFSFISSKDLSKSVTYDYIYYP